MKSSSAFLRVSVLVLLLGTVFLFMAWTSHGLEDAKAFHSRHELDAFLKGGGTLAVGENTYFKTSGHCYGCHGPDANNFSMIDSNGFDVNVSDDWRSTMMANSARDPFWRAKVSHEILVNPAHQVALENKCTSCHAPAGNHNNRLTGIGPYSIAQLDTDVVGQDGVSCVPCHIQSADSIGLLFSGNLRFDTLGRPLYGPYDDGLFGSPMSSFVGYEPLYSPHINDAGLCAGCHTLITETVDLSGVLTGGHFVEQATYHEWLNSSFNTDVDPDNGITCQGCHVPRIDDAIVISANYLFLDGRSPYGLHHFAGANTFMLQLLKNNSVALGLTATASQFDSTINLSYIQLQQNSLMLDVTMEDRTTDTAFIDVDLTNLAGHKFPSGYPSRRAFVELDVLNDEGDTLFSSGGWDADYEVNGHDAEWEPHHDVITAEDQAQIYEQVMADVNGNKTTVLERAASLLKDNRLAPLGFTTSHASYDTTLIVNVPVTDIDFNHDGLGVEGSGTDIVHYHVPMNGYAGPAHVHARFWYQTAPPRWMQEMFAYNSAEIDSFRTMYDNADGTPVLVETDSLTDTSLGIDDVHELGVRIFPNPVRDGILRIDGLSGRVLGVEVFEVGGRLVALPALNGRSRLVVQLPPGKGTYIVVFRTASGAVSERVVAY
ncbi:MAG: T9SS type A sorting domain-containing protein [Flavobacteriales bacterium]